MPKIVQSLFLLIKLKENYGLTYHGVKKYLQHFLIVEKLP